MTSRHPSRYVSIVALLFLILSSSVLIGIAHADTPADPILLLVTHNDHRKAREEFKKRYRADSTDLEALKGLIMLTEIQGDAVAFDHYVHALINHGNLPPLDRALFEAMVDSVPESNGQASVATRVLNARKKIYRREYDEADALLDQIIGDYNWSFIGPFKNIAGSGHIIRFPVEKGKFDEDAVYRDESGLLLSWFRPRYLSPDRIMDVSYHIPDDTRGVVYANTFIEMPESRQVQLRIARSAPLKMWIDDALVFDNPDVTGFDYDNEIVDVKLEKGNHRILIKLSPVMQEDQEYTQLRFRDGGLIDQTTFVLRITDENGVLIPGITSTKEANYKPRTYPDTNYYRPQVNNFLNGVQHNPDDLFAYYSLCKTYIKTGFTQEGEEFFVKALRNNPSSVTLRYLLAKLYAVNGKIELVYETLGEVDHEKTPVFGLMYESLTQIDPMTDETRYLESLGALQKIAPSHPDVVEAAISFYDMKEMKTEKDNYIDSVISAWPDYKIWVERYRSDYKYRSEVDERGKREKIDSLLGELEKEHHWYHYKQVIDYFIDKEEFDKVVELYDRQIKDLPYVARYRYDKADYLYEEKEYEDALDELQIALGIFPYGIRYLVLAGDACDRLGKKEEALDYYRRAWNCEAPYQYTDESILKKIESIEGMLAVKPLFGTKTFKESLADDSWKDKFRDEESVILMYTQDVLVDTLGQLRSYQQMLVKILTESGVNSWTEYDFSLLGNLTSVTVIKEHGTDVIPDRMRGYVVFKNLKPGDMIRLEGQMTESLAGYLDREFYRMAFFSFHAPIHYAKFQVLVPEGRYMGYLHHNLEDNVVKKHVSSYDSYTWEYADLPKIHREEAIVDEYDIQRSILISSMKDWSKVVEWYQRMTYRKFEMKYDVREELQTIVDDSMTDREKVIAVYNHITRRVNYSFVPFFQSAYTPKDAALTLSASIGDCKDVATLMITMLRELGIDAYYVLVKTKNFSSQKILPSLLFDHVIVAADVEGERMYMDLTTDYYPYYVYPEGDCGAWALLIKDGEDELFQLPDYMIDPERNTIELDIRAEMKANRSVALDVTATDEGIRGGNIREVLNSLSKDEIRNFISGYLGAGVFQDLQIVDWNYHNRAEFTEPLRSAFTFSSQRFSDKVSNLLIFRIPYMMPIYSNAALQNEKRMNRLNIIDFVYVEPTRQRVELKFPEGFELTEFPEDVSVSSEFGEYRVTYKEMEGGMIVEKYQQFSMTTIPVEKYADFREFYLKILDFDEARYAIMRPK